MEIKIFIISSLILSGCSSLPNNFKIETEIKEIDFYSNGYNYEGFGNYMDHVYVDTFFQLEIVNLSSKDLNFYHDNTFVIPNEMRFPISAFRNDQTVIKYFDQNKNELFGSFLSINIDSSHANKEIFKSEILDTTTYEIRKYDKMKIIQRIKLPYKKNTNFITIPKPVFINVRYIQFCLSFGKKRKDRLYGCNCTDLIIVKHK